MIRGVLTLSFMFCVAIVTGVSAQSYPTGPFSNELDYFKARMQNTTTLEPSDAIGLFDAVRLQIEDQISDGCWTNVAAVKSRIRAELERSNIAVYDEVLFSHTARTPIVLITGVGGRNDNLCIGNFKISIYGFDYAEFGSLASSNHVFKVLAEHVYWRRSVIQSGRSLNDMILRKAQQWIDEFVGERASVMRSEAVKDFRTTLPDLQFITERDFFESRKN